MIRELTFGQLVLATALGTTAGAITGCGIVGAVLWWVLA